MENINCLVDCDLLMFVLYGLSWGFLLREAYLSSLDVFMCCTCYLCNKNLLKLCLCSYNLLERHEVEDSKVQLAQKMIKQPLLGG